ncbi:dihydrofolate reductase family protein [Silvibacterium sp.]|uniref:dihydrofolate reductase family protein n=1 Tax=Silvibacterium sp. TaxID=1964179 RepID=UPI0039E67C64
MQKICYSVAMSLDGYIAGPNGEADWIGADPETNFAEIWSRFDILLMGRKTYEAARSGFEQFGTQGSKIVVASQTLRANDAPNIAIISHLTRDAVAGLRAQSKKDIWLFGGGHLFRSLLKLHAVDSIEVAIIPVLLGTGVPLLPAGHEQTTLELLDHKSHRSGRVLLNYAVQY